MNRITTTMLVAAISVTACATPPPTIAHGNPIHKYEVHIRDSSGKPIETAIVSLSVTLGQSTVATKEECRTDLQGICIFSIPVNLSYPVGGEFNLEYTSYSIRTSYSVNKQGFYGVTSKLSSKSHYYPTTDVEDPVKDSVVLYSPADYLSEEFLNSPVNRELREQALKFISLIRLQSLIVDADIMMRGTSTSTFKGKKYFQVKIDTTSSYNSLKLDKYGIGKTLFDESIRKILNPLNDNISNPKAFYGYDLIIYGYTKNFADERASGEKVEYRFLIPQNTVKRYKDKDISGQQLLDASVILMNDERIDLKLQ